MKVVFLDIDGVLNSGRQMWKQKKQRPFDPEAVYSLNHILKQTGAKIVVSSTWRINRTVEQLQEILTLEGLPPNVVVDKTPRLYESKEYELESGIVIAFPRFREIEAWLAEHPKVTRWVVIDDDSDAGRVGQENFFKVSFVNGLTYDVAQKIVSYLS